MASWIWIEKEDAQPWQYDPFGQNDAVFKMAELTREYEINGKAKIRICADTRYELYIDGELIGRGPASPGGDFGMDTKSGSLKYCYYDEYTVNKQGRVRISAVVTTIPTVLNEFTFNYPGLWMEIYEGKSLIGQTDESWLGAELVERENVLKSDYTKAEKPYAPVFVIPNKHKLKKCPLELLTVDKIIPSEFKKITLGANESIKIKYDLPKIYSAYFGVGVKCSGRVSVKLTTEEIDGVSTITEEIITDKNVFHRSQRMYSIGQITLEATNESDSIAEIDSLVLDYVRYPVKNKAYFNCSDKALNKVYDVCMHTLEICRQNTHLDSPTHQEPLACSGDYYIQALMEYLNIYDPTLNAFDIYRTAERLKYSKGFMFHTSYSLMLTMWLHDHYIYTGDKSLVKKSKKAMEYLFSRFDSYTSSENGLLEKAPNYMFVDWIVMKDAPDPYGDARDMMSHGEIDGFSLHHPPKALGQSALCMFYYQSLIMGAKLFDALEDSKMANELEARAAKLKEAINTHLYDKEKGLYIGGLTTPNEVSDYWLPENCQRTFYLKQANVLAVLFDIAPCEQKEAILDYVCKDLRKEEMQPYFYHFLFEALYNEGLFGKYAFDMLKRYDDLVNKTDKGLCEAWEYIKCDCSHAWGGSPAYILKKAISGFEILDNGYKKIRLKPNLYHLEFASFNISTPYGNIDVNLQRGKEPQIVAPSQIEIVLE